MSLTSMLIVICVSPQIVNDPVTRNYPPSRKYIARFWKSLYSRIESSRLEVCDSLLHAMEHVTLQTADEDDSSELSFRTFALDPTPGAAPCLVTMREAQCFNEVGLTTWNAAFVLTEYLAAHQPLPMFGASVLELGSGTGFLPVALARLWQNRPWPARFVLTDSSQEVLDNLRQNLIVSKDACSIAFAFADR